jgi:hypothetical protein
MADSDKDRRVDLHPDAATPPARESGSVLVETARALRGGWRGMLLAVITASIGVLLADLLGSSEDAVVAVAVLGAAIGASLNALAATFPLRERTLSALAGVLAFVAWPRARTWIVKYAGPASEQTSSASFTSATLAPAAVATVIGAAAGIALGSYSLADDGPRGFESPEIAIAALLDRRTFEYMGSCARFAADPPPSRPGPDRRVCSLRLGREDGGYVYGIGNLDHAAPFVVLQEDERGWTVVHCFDGCG